MKTSEHHHRKNARRILNLHKYKVGGHVQTAAKRAAIKAVHEHEKSDHPGKKLTKIKLARGGCATGGKAKERADKPRRASGGRNKKAGTKVIIVNAGGGAPQHQPVPVPVPHPVPVPAAGGPPGAPPMGARPPMPPPGAIPPRPGMPMQKRGGAARARGGNSGKGAEGKEWEKRVKGAGMREERGENAGER